MLRQSESVRGCNNQPGTFVCVVWFVVTELATATEFVVVWSWAVVWQTPIGSNKIAVIIAAMDELFLSLFIRAEVYGVRKEKARGVFIKERKNEIVTIPWG